MLGPAILAGMAVLALALATSARVMLALGVKVNPAPPCYYLLSGSPHTVCIRRRVSERPHRGRAPAGDAPAEGAAARAAPADGQPRQADQRGPHRHPGPSHDCRGLVHGRAPERCNENYTKTAMGCCRCYGLFTGLSTRSEQEWQAPTPDRSCSSTRGRGRSGRGSTSCGARSPGRESHPDTTLYISLAILYTTCTGWCPNHCNVYALGGRSSRSSATKPGSRLAPDVKVIQTPLSISHS